MASALENADRVRDCCKETEAGLEARLARVESALRAVAETLQIHGFNVGRRLEPASGEPRADDALTNREREVLRLLSTGLRVGTIARTLEISTHTVRNHLKAIFRKLGVRSQEELLERLRGGEAAGPLGQLS